MRKLFCCMVAAATCFGAMAQGRAPGAIEYKTVAAALAQLKAKKGASISVQGGYTVIEDKAADAVWSFVPVGHPAYPAVVRRATVVKDGKAGVAMATLCQSGKSACDKLAAEFEKRDPGVAREVRAKAYSAHGVPLSEVEAERLGENAYRLTLTSFTSKTVQAGQQELQAKAAQLCGAKSANFGKYEFNLTESYRDGGKDQGHFLLKQHLVCGDANPGAPDSAPTQQATPASASAAQVERVEQLTRQYFAAKDQRRYQEAYAMLAPSHKETESFALWQPRLEQASASAGAAGERRFKQITWYRDPPQAAPGLYAAIDFEGQFANLAIDCGFVAWQEQPDGSFLVVHEEENVLDKTVAKKLHPAELDKARAHFGCRD